MTRWHELFVYFVIQDSGHAWARPANEIRRVWYIIYNSVDCGEMMLLCVLIIGCWISCVPYMPMLRASGPYVRM